MKTLDYFSYEVKPFSYAGNHGGTEKLLTINVIIDGEEHSETVPFEVPANTTEIEYYTRRAVSSLMSQLELEEVNA